MSVEPRGNAAVAANPFVTVEEVLEILRMKSARTLNVMAARGEIPRPRKAGKRLLWSRRELAEALNVEL
jgi:predicted DNA-binding transcriptional regulator AlpA